MVRAPCCEKMGLKKGPWTPEEDQILMSFIHNNGHGNWRALPKQAGLLRCGKSCRLRWTNYLRPDIKRGNFSTEEEENIIKLHEVLGNRWSAIAAKLPGRTDNEIKNVWHTHLKKKLKNYQPPPTAKKKLSSSKVAKAKSRSPTTKDEQNAPKAEPEPSTSEMSTVTDSSGLKMNSDVLDSLDQSPPIDESFWSEQSSSEMSDSSAMNGLPYDEFVIKNEEMDLSLYIRHVDRECLWPRSFPMDNAGGTQPEFQCIGEESNFKFPSTSTTSMESDSNVCLTTSNEDMDFWFNLFIRAEDLPELPEF